MVGMVGRSKSRQHVKKPLQDEPVSLQLIASKLDRLVWRKRLWGVDERQVWHVVKRMDEMYRQLYREQQVRYEVLLAEARGESMPAAAGSPTPQPPVPQPPQSPQAAPATPVTPVTAPNPYAAQPRPAGSRFRKG